VHHELCFGCGQANLFGLQLELTRDESGDVSGRFFVKQDHQGPDGAAHPGVLAAALAEALSADGPVGSFTVSLVAPAPVGSFVHVRATGSSATASAEDGAVLARASSAPPNLDI
jgi:acyl-coenzyme A thioesterase PaaI-like protein